MIKFALSGFLKETDNSWPSIISFKPKFEQGALLTIVSSYFICYLL